MADYDIFNGDADGILSLVQLRRAHPRNAALITGRKRDIDLLKHIDGNDQDRLVVLDISMKSNADDLRRLLTQGANVFYVDHHNAGDIPDHPNLTAIIDTSPEICTAMLIDAHINGAYRAWAVTAAFGDNFPALAQKKAQGLELPLDRLEELGVLINYNGYGAKITDLHFHPADLYRAMCEFDTPMEFLTARPDVFEKLKSGYEEDMQNAQNSKILSESDCGLILTLEDNASSRRVSGVYGNDLAQKFPQRAHAILTKTEGGFVVSVRAPIERRTGADTLCLQFETADEPQQLA